MYPAAFANMMIKPNSSEYVSLTAREMLQLLIREKTRVGSAFMVLKYWPLNSLE